MPQTPEDILPLKVFQPPEDFFSHIDEKKDQIKIQIGDEKKEPGIKSSSSSDNIVQESSTPLLSHSATPVYLNTIGHSFPTTKSKSYSFSRYDNLVSKYFASSDPKYK